MRRLIILAEVALGLLFASLHEKKEQTHTFCYSRTIKRWDYSRKCFH